VSPNDLSGAWAAGGAVSSARDLDRFPHRALLLPAARRGDGREHDRSPRRARRGDRELRAGALVYRFDCVDALGHDGAFAGYRTAAFHNPDEDRSMVQMVNTDDDLGALDYAGTAALCP
jgi:hypothetical protein